RYACLHGWETKLRELPSALLLWNRCAASIRGQSRESAAAQCTYGIQYCAATRTALRRQSRGRRGAGRQSVGESLCVRKRGLCGGGGAAARAARISGHVREGVPRSI